MSNVASEVIDAAEAIVTAFGQHDVDAYFSSFAPDTTFIFYNSPRVLRSVAQYQDLWKEWEQDGFHVDSCESIDGQVQFLTDDVALFTHRVHTVISDNSGTAELDERESIVFRRSESGSWVGVHEHLSPLP
jgi:ketosteroid isomerase-like protein